ncbi:hypothetical protein H0A70_05460 [Alcaligenaceae bacterium]|nr:hypothetical protein [Alcaligenaceae bacterium]
MKVSEVASAESGRVGSMRPGVLQQKFLLTGKDGSPNNYLLNVGRTGTGGWTTPRHRHNFDQIRYVLKGTYPYAKGKSMEEGWVGYFPEGVFYGPQARPEGLEMMVCQFGGASGEGFVSVADREAANTALEKKGKFENGIFTWYDENGKRHNQDGSEACMEHAMGRKLVYPKPRYDDLVMMDPANYAWVPQGAPGVFTKWLGSFTERCTKIGLLRIEENASFDAGLEDSIELMFLAKGKVNVDGKDYGPHSAFELQAKEGPIAFKAVAEAEFLRIVLPKF